jgi:hypothetical protein
VRAVIAKTLKVDFEKVALVYKEERLADDVRIGQLDLKEEIRVTTQE